MIYREISILTELERVKVSVFNRHCNSFKARIIRNYQMWLAKMDIPVNPISFASLKKFSGLKPGYQEMKDIPFIWQHRKRNIVFK